MRALARRLLDAAHESRASTTETDGLLGGAHSDALEAAQVCETLRISLGRFTGVDGFAALMRRATARTAAEFPALRSARVHSDGRLEGVETLGSDEAIALTAHLLELLVTFIGEPLTLKLLHQVWPDLPLHEPE